jgi:chemotaxis methyl-accepting protein methylase
MSDLERVTELVRRESGISLNRTQEGALEAAIARVLPGEDAGGFLRRADEPVTGPKLVQRLLDEVTVNETFFLRNRTELETIDWPELVREGAARLWVAGCATGEEAYSLVLLAGETLDTPDPPIDVLATDVSEAALEAAETALYRPRSLAGLTPEERDRHFSEQNGMWAPAESLRRLVRFGRHNLARDPAPPLGEEPFDLITCRNVLIYFDRETVERVVGGLERALTPGGTLLLGAADALQGASRPAERTPPRREPKPSAPQVALADALAAADAGKQAEALAATSALLAHNPLDAEAYFVQGLLQLEGGAATDAAASLRRALYVNPRFSLAAFTLGRAYDALAEPDQALRAYEQALRTLDPEDDRQEELLRQVDLGDIAAACRARIAALR